MSLRLWVGKHHHHSSNIVTSTCAAVCLVRMAVAACGSASCPYEYMQKAAVCGQAAAWNKTSGRLCPTSCSLCPVPNHAHLIAPLAAPAAAAGGGHKPHRSGV